MKHKMFPKLTLFMLLSVSCAQEHPFLSGHIRRATDAFLAPCDPYNKGAHHSCLIFSSASRDSLYAYDATAGELVLAPNGFFPLKIKAGAAVDTLANVLSTNDKFPYFLALDRAKPSMNVYRLFPAADGSKSFAAPAVYPIDKSPYHLAALEQNGEIFLLMTFPDEGLIKVVVLDKDSGKPHDSYQRAISIGTRPSRIAIDYQRTKAVITDEGENNIHTLDVTTIADVVKNGASPLIEAIALGMTGEQVFLAHRDFGEGLHVYALIFNAHDKDIRLLNVDTKIWISHTLPEEPMAGYLPDQDSSSCCKDTKHWISLVTLKGNLHYLSINQQSGGLALASATTVDLTSEDNLSLSRVHIRKIVGGAILKDKSLKKESICASHRQTFYISSFGSRKSYLNMEPLEVEAHGYSCEGESSASRFGFKTK